MISRIAQEFFGEQIPESKNPEPETPEPESIAERVAIRFENESPADLGTPIFWHKGTPLAFENDAPVTKVYSWCAVSLFGGRPLNVDVEPVGRLLGLSPQAVREALKKLVLDGDLAVVRERGRELFRLNVQYSEGGKDEAGS